MFLSLKIPLFSAHNCFPLNQDFEEVSPDQGCVEIKHLYPQGAEACGGANVGCRQLCLQPSGPL